MSILKSPLLRGARGQFAGVTLLQRDGDTVMRQSNTNSVDAKSGKQMRRRVRLANLVSMYRASAQWMPKAFSGKRPAWSDFNAFVSANLNNSTVALTKDQAASGACVVAPYLITKGNLFSVNVEKAQSGYITNIRTSYAAITGGDEVGEISRDLIEENSFLEAGMQISFVSYQQIINPVTGFPQVLCNSYELTLDPDNHDTIGGYMPEFCFTVKEVGSLKYIGTTNAVTEGGFLYILSRNTPRGLEVSTQNIVLAGTDFYNQYSSAAQIQAAIISYGFQPDVFLNPNDNTPAQDPGAVASLLGITEELSTIAGLATATITYPAGQVGPDLQAYAHSSYYVGLIFSNDVVVNKVTAVVQSTLYGQELVLGTDVKSLEASPTTASRRWAAMFNFSAATTQTDDKVVKVVVELANGTTITATFPRKNADLE